MVKSKSRAEKTFRWLVYMLPAVLFFSYWPLMHLGSDSSMNFELSLPLLWLVVFDFLVAYLIIKKKLVSKIYQNWLWLLLPVFLTLSVIWSVNSLRGFLTVGILWLLYLAGFGFFVLRDLMRDENFKMRFWRVFFGSALVVCVWCFLQCILDVAGVSREYSLACAGCTYSMFGFPRVSGFAAEPQFMGNLLLAPIVMAAWFYIDKKQVIRNLGRKPSRGCIFNNRSGGPAPKFQFRTRSVTVVKNTSGSGFVCSKFLITCFFVFIVTLFLTMSRGAIYAFIVGMIFMTILLWISKHLTWDRKLGRAASSVSRGKLFRASLKIWLIIIAGFLFALNLQGIMSEVSKTDDTYMGGVNKVINQLSLGLIDFSQPETETKDEVKLETEAVPEKSHFDGYVAVSTDMRLGLSGAALSIWSENWQNAVFGVGLGGASNALSARDLAPTTKEIVNNQYVSLLLETGIVGIGLLILTLVLLFKLIWRNELRVPILALVIAYLVSLVFFAGLPNVLHIYLLPTVILAIYTSPSSRRKKLVS